MANLDDADAKQTRRNANPLFGLVLRHPASQSRDASACLISAIGASKCR